MIKNFFLFFWALALFATLSKAQVSSVTGQYLQDNNLLLNPGFESGIGKWTNSAGTFTADYSVFVQGKASGKVVLSSQALNFFQDSTIFASQLADGMQAILTVKIKSSVAGVRVCPRQAGSVITSLCIDVQGNNKWGLYQIPFVTGATSQGISINSNGNSITGTVYVDESYVGVSNILNSSSEAKLAGEAYFAGTSGCVWSRTSTTVGAFGTTAACPGPTISYQSLGQWQTTDSDLPRITVNNLPAGVYKATFHVWVSMVTTQVPALSINDGTTSCYPIYSEQSSLAASSQVVSCTFTYTSSGNRIFELYGASNSSTINISNPSYTPAASGTKFQLEYYGSNSTYTTLNADTDWAACNFSTLAWQGLGTVTHDLKCKRQGSDLLMKGRFTTGTVTGSEARIPLPLWNGQSLQVGNSQKVSLYGIYGSLIRDSGTANVSKDLTILSGASFSFLNIGVREYVGVTTPFSPIAGSSGFANSNVGDFEARIPIEGWQNSNIIIGAFNALEKCTDSYECTDVFSASISSAGVVSGENIDWINGNCATSDVAKYDCSYKSGIFTVAPNCNITILRPSSVGRTATLNSLSSSLLSYYIYNDAGQEANEAKIICQKQGADYIGKTAKAVASDQNVRSIGAVGVDIQSVYFGSGASCLSPCTTATCTICKQVGSKITSITRTTNGTYNLNGIDGTKYQCTGTANNSSTAVGVLDNEGSSTTSFRRIVTYNGGVTTDAGMASVQCIGVP